MKTKFLLFLLCLLPVLIHAQNKISGYVYWFNNEYDQRVSQEINPEQYIDLSLSIATEGLSAGLNIFNFQAYDSENKLTTTASKFFYKAIAGVYETNRITKYRYWFNNDIENAVVVNVEAKDQIDYVVSIDTDTLSLGLYTVNFQLGDDTGHWSIPKSKIFIEKPNGPDQNIISGYRYWFDNDFANAVTDQLSEPMPESNVFLPVDMTSVPKGKYILHYQTVDAYGFWSSAISREFTKLSFPVAAFEADTTASCAPVEVHFTNKSIDANEYLWDFGDGETSTEFQPKHTFIEAGEHIVKLTVKDSTTEDQLSSTNQLKIVVHLLPSAEVIQEGNVLTAVAADAEYQWINCKDNSPIPGATSQVFVSTENGNYAVLVTLGDCVNTSECYPVITIGVDYILCENVKIYPNPNKGKFVIVFDKIYNDITYTILNVQGKTIYQSTERSVDEIYVNKQLAKGLYFIKISNESNETVIKLIIK